MPFAQPRGDLTTVSRWRSCRDFWRATPPEVEKCEASYETLEGGLARSLHKRLRSSADLLQDKLPWLWPRGFLWSVSYILGDGGFCRPPWIWHVQSSGHMYWVERTPHHQSCHQGFSEEYTVLLYGDANWIVKHHGAGGNSFPRSPSLVGWPLILPMVC